jgi:RDD family
VTAGGASVSPWRALARYLLAWLWFAPALIAAHLAGLQSAAQIFTLLVVGVFAFAMLAFLHPQRQFLHDVVCGTRLVTWRAKSPR